jgi:hypothetical protein
LNPHAPSGAPAPQASASALPPPGPGVNLEPRHRFERWACRLRNGCSATELPGQDVPDVRNVAAVPGIEPRNSGFRARRVCQRPLYRIGALCPPDVVTEARFELARSPLLGRDLCRVWATRPRTPARDRTEDVRVKSAPGEIRTPVQSLKGRQLCQAELTGAHRAPSGRRDSNPHLLIGSQGPSP